MKKILKISGIVALFIALIGISSCDKEEGTIILPSMKASVDGSEWSSLLRVSVLHESGTSSTMVITGTPTLSLTADQTIILTISGAAVGTYTFGIGESTATAQCGIVYKKTSDADPSTNKSNYFTSTQATISITKIDKEKKTISGTFSGTLYALTVTTPISITNGTFENLTYTVQ